MNKGKVINLKNFNSILVFSKNNWCLLTLTFCLILGLISGTLLYKYSGFFYKLSGDFTKMFLELRISGSFLKVFGNSFLLSFIFLLLNFIFGTSVAGITLVPLILVARGVLFAMTACEFYARYALIGIAFNTLYLIPSNLLSILFLIFSSKLSLLLSITVAKITMPKTTPKNLAFYFSDYCKKYLIFSIPAVISALLDATLSLKLLPYFNL